MTSHRFYKESDGGWFIDLPEYLSQGGSKEDLAMVAGADTMLDTIAQGPDQVTITMDTEPFDGADELILIRIVDPAIGGGDYLMKSFENKEVNQEMWLCSVTKFVFGDIPLKIFVRREPL